MNRNLKKVLALALTAMMLLSACGKTEETKAPESNQANNQTSNETAEAAPAAPAAPEANAPEYESITDLVLSGSAPNTFNILNTETSTDRVMLINLVEGLCDNNEKGQLIPAVATDWESSDNGKTWTFKLRNNAKWVDVNGKEKAAVTSADWATGMEWVLNFHKNSSFNSATLVDMIDGAAEYLEYTKGLDASEALALGWEEGSKFREMVGIDIPDEYTIVYTCTREIPYFASITTTSCLYPLAQGLIDEVGVENVNAVTNKNMWYNSCYTMTTYEHGGEVILTKNPLYWDTDCTLFNTVTYKTVESSDMAYMLYENGEIDHVSLGQSQMTTIYEDENHPFHNYLVESTPGRTSNQMHINFDKNMADGSGKDVQWNTAVANEAFRKAMFYGVDFTEYFKRFNAIDPMKCTNDFYTRSGVVYTTDGTDYVELVRDLMEMDDYSDTKIAHLNKEKAEQYKKQAMEELTAQGITFPVRADYWVGGSQSDQDSGLVLKQCFEESLGSDFIEINLCTYVKDFYSEVRDTSTQAFGIFGYGGTYADPSTYLRHELYNDTAWFTNKYSHIIDLPEDSEVVSILKEYTKMYDAACAIVDDHDARMKAFAQAEAYLLDHAITVPVYITNSWCLTKVDPNSQMRSMLAGTDSKMKNWVTNVDGFTREQVEEK